MYVFKTFVLSPWTFKPDWN